MLRVDQPFKFVMFKRCLFKRCLFKVCLFTLLIAMAHQSLIAQVGRSKKKSKKNSSEAELSKEELQEMESQANKIKEDYVKQMATLATGYAKGGEYEKSKAILRKLREVAPGIPGVKEKIQQLNKALISKNEVTIDFKVTSSSWD